LRSCTHCDCASARRPLARCVPRAFELDERLGAATQPCDDEDDDGDDAALPLLTCVKPLSDVPAVESALSAVDDEASVELSLAGAAAADSSAADAASEDEGDESSDVVVVVDSIAAELSSAIDAEKRSPATAASEAPAKNNAVKTKVVASRRLRPLGSRDAASSGLGLPPKSQLSLRVNHRGIAVCSFSIEPLAATRGAECGLVNPSAAACGAPGIGFERVNLSLT
jgi:hypothetical protein